MYVRSLILENYKCFDIEAISFSVPKRNTNDASVNNYTLIVGDNRSGKSAILKAIAFNAICPILSGSGFRPVFLSRNKAVKSSERVDSDMLVGAVKGTYLLSESELDIEFAQRQAFVKHIQKVVDVKFDPAKIPSMLGFAVDFQRIVTSSQEKLNYFIVNPFEQITFFEDVISKIGVKDFFENFRYEEHLANSVLFGEFSPYCFVAGYHPSRRIELAEWNAAAMNRQRGIRYQRVAGLFEEQVSLRPLTGWFQTLSKQRQQEVEHLLASLLGGKPIRLTEAPQRDIYVDLGDGPLPFSVLSDGYRAFLAWTTDLIGQMCDVIPDTMALTDMTGIVLIDEIDAHLHPKWQRRVVQDVTRTFPNLQFIATTHSPLVAGTVHPENVLVTELQDDGTATVRRGTEALIGRSANEILLSSYFGLDSTRSGPVAEEITKLLRQATDGDQDAALKAMRLLAGRE
ncbi:MAG: hypothetical protein EAZ99_15880 [Alphaproteobacteria bacterium]|nr:MAG: hypothetical protein EAZ99_15880 [Alphaproteobacteria bacterium]